MDLVSYALAKKYTDKVMAGTGAIKGEKGDDGLTPYIGDNGNWFIGDTDTGVLGDVNKKIDVDGKLVADIDSNCVYVLKDDEKIIVGEQIKKIDRKDIYNLFKEE